MKSFLDLPADAKIRFLPAENYGFPRYISVEEALHLANWEADPDCPLRNAGKPFTDEKL